MDIEPLAWTFKTSLLFNLYGISANNGADWTESLTSFA